MVKTEYLPLLLQVFRQYGYDGTSIARISEATGLGKASLYHHFPGGKQQMAEEVFGHIRESFYNNVLKHLYDPGTPKEKLKRYCEAAEKHYKQGTVACICEAFSNGDAMTLFQPLVQLSLERQIEGLASVARESGFTAKQARERAEDAIVRIQGSLVVSRGLADNACFFRVLKGLPALLLENHK